MHSKVDTNSGGPCLSRQSPDWEKVYTSITPAEAKQELQTHKGSSKLESGNHWVSNTAPLQVCSPV